MKKIVIRLAALFALTTSANAATTTVEDFRGTVQTVTSTTSPQTLSLGATTTIVRINVASNITISGMDGGADGRVVFFWNVGAGTAWFVHEDTSATSTNRWKVDANTGSRALFGGTEGMGVAVYDGTTGRWRFGPLSGYNTGGSLQVNGSFSVYDWSALGQYATVRGPQSTRLYLTSDGSGDNSSSIRWQNSASTALFTMGPDYWGDGGANWWFYDNTNSLTPLYLDQASDGVSWLSMGASSGGMEWDENDWPSGAATVDGLLRFFANGLYRMTVSDFFVAFNSQPYYQRPGSAPTLDSNCNGSGTATFARDESSDARGAITLGTGATACTMNFAIPWDLIGGTEPEVREGFPICVANTSTSGRSVAITNITDHLVTFTPSASGATTIYYHCDGVLQSDVFD